MSLKHARLAELAQSQAGERFGGYRLGEADQAAEVVAAVRLEEPVNPRLVPPERRQVTSPANHVQSKGS